MKHAALAGWMGRTGAGPFPEQPTRIMKPLLPLVTITLLAGSSFAQLAPGTFLAAIPTRGVFAVDRFAETTTPLSINGINWAQVNPRRTRIESATSFLLLTSKSGSPFVYRVTWSGGAWQAAPLGGIPKPDFGWSIARIGTWIYVARSLNGNGQSTTDAEIWRMPGSGGPATLFFHLSQAGVRGMPTAMVGVGNELHVFMHLVSSQTGGEHVSLNTGSTPPILTKRGLLPWSNRCVGYPIMPRQACFDPYTGLIVLGSRTADILWIRPGGATVHHDVIYPFASMPCLGNPDHWGESLAVNTDTGAVLVGDGNGQLEEKVCDRWQHNVQTVAASAPVLGLEYFPRDALYRETGPGCAQSNGKFPCNYLRDLPVRGKNLSVTVDTPNQPGWLVLGAQQINVPLGPIAPGCVIGPALHAIVAGSRSGNHLEVVIKIPAGLPPGSFAYAQWAVADPINRLGLVWSDTRYLKL